jgi:uncharacterized protein YbaA (DUF1428 family)
MANYIDGFVFAIPVAHLAEYQRLAESVAHIWREHGALSYQEFVGDDMTLAGTRSFTDAVTATESDVIVFGWVTFASRQARDLANEKVASDPLVTELMESSRCGFDAQQMMYGGFRSFVSE